VSAATASAVVAGGTGEVGLQRQNESGRVSCELGLAQRVGGVRHLKRGVRVSGRRQRRALSLQQLRSRFQQLVETQRQRGAPQPIQLLRYDTRCYFKVRSKDDTSQLNLPHVNQQLRSKKQICSEVSVNSPGNPCSQSRRRKERLRWEGFAEKEGFKPRMKE